MHIFQFLKKERNIKVFDFECLDLTFGILWLFWWVWCLMEVWERRYQEDEDWSWFNFTKKMMDLFYSFWSLDYVDIPLSIRCGKKLGYITRVNTKLTFWIYLINGTNIEGIFGSFHWSRDVPDSDVHFQGPKWGFTLKVIKHVNNTYIQEIDVTSSTKSKISYMYKILNSRSGYKPYTSNHTCHDNKYIIIKFSKSRQLGNLQIWIESKQII